MFDKTIKIKFKTTLQLLTSIWKIGACYWKSQRLDKKEKSSKPLKKEYKAKPAESQFTLLGKAIQPSSQSP